MQCSCQPKFHVRDNKVLIYLLTYLLEKQAVTQLDLMHFPCARLCIFQLDVTDVIYVELLLLECLRIRWCLLVEHTKMKTYKYIGNWLKLILKLASVYKYLIVPGCILYDIY